MEEAKVFRSFASFEKLRSVATEAGREVQPDEMEKVEMPEMFPIDPDEERDVVNA